jgi:hypothetical protein
MKAQYVHWMDCTTSKRVDLHIYDGSPKCLLAAVAHVQEAIILIFVGIIHTPHQVSCKNANKLNPSNKHLLTEGYTCNTNVSNWEHTCLGQSVVHKDEKSHSLRQMQPGTQYKNELPNWHITWNQVPAITIG